MTARPFAPLAIAIALSLPFNAQAQDTRLLTRVQVVAGAANTCPAVFIVFSSRLTLSSQSTEDGGRTLLVRLARDPGQRTTDAGAPSIETYPDIELPGLGTVSVALDATGSVPTLSLSFAMPVVAQVAQAGESSVVITAIHAAGGTCGGPAPAATASAAPSGPTGPQTDYFEARRLITAGDYPRAIQLLTRFLSGPENDLSPDAQELLGLARERNGQLAHARAEYETYLKKYPDNPGAARVRQRLAALNAPATRPSTAVATAPQASTATTLPPPPRPRRAAQATPEPAAPTLSGRFSTYYLRNQGSTYFTEFETNTNNKDTQVYQDALVSSLDVEGSSESRKLKTSWRVAGDYTTDFADTKNNKLSLSRAYMDWEAKGSGAGLRLGRQTRNDSGVFGRFDGAEFRLPIGDTATVRTFLGSPVETSSDAPYATKKAMAGMSLGFKDLTPGLTFDVYAIAQQREGFTDRQAVGTDLQFQSKHASLVAIVDYDVYFSTLNLARISGTWLGQQGSSFSITADYSHSPLLSVGNALTGQTVTTLEELSATYTTAELQQLALDRTPDTSSLTLTWTQPLSEKWQLSIDTTAYKTGATPASGGVAATPATGPEYFGSVQVVGSNLLGRRDTISAALRLANTESSDLALFDSYVRFNATDKLRLKPRARIGYRVLAAGGTEVFGIPSINMAFKFDKQNDIEIEVGGRISSLKTPTYAQETNEAYVTAGFNRQF